MIPPRTLRGRRARGSRIVLVAAAAGALAGGLACAPDSFTPTPDGDASRLFWGLTLDQHAITLSTVSPYDTVRLTATPRSWDGAPMTDPPPVTFTSSDPTRLAVGADGTVQATGAAAGIRVIASATIGNIRHADTATVDVTTEAQPNPLTSFSIQPVAPDSAIWGANALDDQFFSFGAKQIQAHDAIGNPIGGVRVHFASSDTMVAAIDPVSGELRGNSPGRVTIRADASTYGAKFADSVEYTITMPAAQAELLIHDPDADTTSVLPRSVTITAGGVVLFFNYSYDTMGVVFDDSTKVAEDQTFCFCGGGNIAPFTFEDFRTRSFPTPGTYTFHATFRANMVGKVIVVPPPTASASRAPSSGMPFRPAAAPQLAVAWPRWMPPAAVLARMSPTAPARRSLRRPTAGSVR